MGMAHEHKSRSDAAVVLIPGIELFMLVVLQMRILRVKVLFTVRKHFLSSLAA